MRNSMGKRNPHFLIPSPSHTLFRNGLRTCDFPNSLLKYANFSRNQFLCDGFHRIAAHFASDYVEVAEGFLVYFQTRWKWAYLDIRGAIVMAMITTSMAVGFIIFGALNDKDLCQPIANYPKWNPTKYDIKDIFVLRCCEKIIPRNKSASF